LSSISIIPDLQIKALAALLVFLGDVAALWVQTIVFFNTGAASAEPIYLSKVTNAIQLL